MKFKHMLGLLSAAAMSLALTGVVVAQQTVKIGAIFSLSGNAANAGIHAKAAIEVAVDIINNDHPELGDFPLAKGAGLPGLGGAKVEVVFVDNQGSHATGQNQALRLITEEKIVALTGAYQSGITLTVSAITEKYGVPFVNDESVTAGLTERGFKWFFRYYADRERLCKGLLRIPHRHEGDGRQGRQHRAGPRNAMTIDQRSDYRRIRPFPRGHLYL
jgi:branched-chain amino acid transport system substrate-binding protein